MLQGSYIYWAVIFGLLGKIKQQVESLCARFLWGGPDLTKKIHLLSWETICKPLEEGGLNIRRVKEMNRAGVLKHIWRIVTNKESLWVKWVHARYLKHDSIWTMKVPSDCS